MAARAKKTTDQVEPDGSDLDSDVQPMTTAGPIPGTVRIRRNLQRGARDIALSDGTNVRLAPFIRGGSGHISDPIQKKLLPPPVRKMVDRGEIELVEEVSP